MKIQLWSLLFILIMVHPGFVGTGMNIYSQESTPDPIKNYQGIPILTYLGDNLYWNPANSLYKQMDSAGIFGSEVANMVESYYTNSLQGTNLKVIPNQVDGATYNYIIQYSEAHYTVWEAEGTDPADGDAKIFFNDTLGVIEDGAVRTIDSLDIQNKALIYGPYYKQETKYCGVNNESPIYYRADFILRKDDIGAEPPNPNDTICILQVVTNHLDRPLAPAVWVFDSTYVIEDTVIRYSDLEDTNKTFSLGYDLFSLPALFTTDPSLFRSFAGYIEFKVLWKGNSDKVRLYVDKIILSDVRGRDLMDSTLVPSVEERIIDQINNDLLSGYGHKVAGWMGIDEPESIDNFEPIRIVQNIIDTHGGGKGLWIAFGTGWNGRWGEPGDPFGTYRLVRFEEFYKRVKKVNLWSDYYIYDNPYPSNDPRFPNYKELNIKTVVDSNYRYFNNKENVFWGASIQTGGFLDTSYSWLKLREIGNKELLYHTNIALLSGAKVISYWTYFSNIDVGDPVSHTALVNIYWPTKSRSTPPSNIEYTDKWHTLKDTIAPRLRGLMGKTLKNVNQEVQYLKFNFNPVQYLSGFQIGTLPKGSLPEENDFDLGFFTKDDQKYFMFLRRWYNTWTNPVLIDIDRGHFSYNNIKIVDCVNETSHTLEINEKIIFDGGIGDGRLYGLMPVVKDGGQLLYNETISGTHTLQNKMSIESGATLTVNGTYYITADIEVKDGGTLQVQPGANLVFNNGAKLIVNGGLTAVGTSANKITFDFTSQQSGNGINTEDEDFLTLTNCIVKNAVTGLNIIHRSRGTALIRHNKFENCLTGVSLVNATSALIQGNEFINTQYAIFTSNVSGLNIISNNITGNNSNFPGLILNSSSGFVRKNTITGHGYGILLGNSSPFLGTNTIHNNSANGLHIASGSVPDLQAAWIKVPCTNVPIYSPFVGSNYIYNNGNINDTTDGEAEIFLNHSYILLDDGCNTITDDRIETGPPFYTKNLMNGFYDADSPIYARGNTWGYHPSYTLDERFGSLPVIYEPAVCIQPDNVIDCEVIAYTTDGIAIDTFQFVYAVPYDQDELKELYAEASALFEAGDYTQASQVYNEIISGYSTQKESYDAFSKLLVIERLKNSQPQAYEVLKNLYLASLNNITDTLVTKMITQLANLCLVNGGELNEAMDAFQDIIDNNPGTEEADFAEIDLYTTALLDTSTTLNKGGFEKVTAATFNEKLNNLLNKKFGNPNTKSEEKIIPKEYSLYQNYPNPFNPSTTIKYDLPKDGNAELIVYDILGRKITQLVNEYRSAGSYEQRFDASDLASGIYIYQLKAGDFVSTKKMMLVK